MIKNIFCMLVLILIGVSCGNSDNDDSLQNSQDPGNNSGNNSSEPEWLVPVAQVLDGGPGKDGIPSIDSPKFIDPSEASYLGDNDMVVGVVMGSEARAYPHLVLDWHEIVNDVLNNDPITISFCPLTGTAFGWRSIAGGKESTFGVSGLLYNTNLILYDRNTDSNWSQIGLKCINGELINERPTLISTVETNWKTWKALYPTTKVLSLSTGFSREYGINPEVLYKTNNDDFIFPGPPYKSNTPSKERRFVIIDNDESKVYKFDSFLNGKVIKDWFKKKEYLIVGNENIIYSFLLNESQSALNFNYSFNNSEDFFEDNEGNKWSIFGKALEGPRKGEVLGKPEASFVGYWFAIAAFYPNPTVYQ